MLFSWANYYKKNTNHNKRQIMTKNNLPKRLYDSLPNRIQTIISRFFTGVGLDSYLSLLFDSPLRDENWFESFGGLPVGADGEPIPWMPYAFRDFLEPRLDGSMRLFEFGSGNSTRWFASYVDEVVAVEHDKEWYDHLSGETPSNVELVYSETNYAQTVNDFGEFDLIVIDGKDRVSAAKKAVDNLHPEGIIVWDDTNRDQYVDGFQRLRDAGFKEISFQGMGPVSAARQRTSVFYKKENCLNI